MCSTSMQAERPPDGCCSWPAELGRDVGRQLVSKQAGRAKIGVKSASLAHPHLQRAAAETAMVHKSTEGQIVDQGSAKNAIQGPAECCGALQHQQYTCGTSGICQLVAPCNMHVLHCLAFYKPKLDTCYLAQAGAP